MGTEIKKLIDIDYTSLNGLKTAIKEAKAELGKLTIGSEEYYEQMKEVNKMQDAYNTALKLTKDENSDAIGSYNALNKQLAELKKQWKATGDAAERARLTEQVNAVKDKMVEMDHSIGNWQRNVGNYQSALQALSGPLGAVAAGIKTIVVQAKAFIATPIGAALAAVSVAIAAVTQGFKQSESTMDALRVAMAPFTNVTNLLKTAMTSLADAVGSVVTKFTALLDKWGLFSDKAKENQAIVKEEIALRDRQRKVMVENARLEAEIADARAKAASLEGGARAKQLEIAAEKRKQVLENNLAIAEKEFELAKRRAAQAPNDTAANDALAQSEARLWNVRQSYSQGMMEINSGMRSALKQAAKESNDTTEVMLADLQKIFAAAERSRAEMEKFWGEQSKELSDDIEAEWREAYDEAGAVADEYWQQLAETAAKEKEINAQRVASLFAYGDAASDVLNSVAQLMLSGTDVSERTERQAKNLQIAAATIQTISGAVSAYMGAIKAYAALGPAATPIAAVQAASVLAAGMANIAKIRATNVSKDAAPNGAAAPTRGFTTRQAPPIVYNTQTTRTLTGEQEAQAASNAAPLRAYIVASEAEAWQRAAAERRNESQF